MNLPETTGILRKIPCLPSLLHLSKALSKCSSITRMMLPVATSIQLFHVNCLKPYLLVPRTLSKPMVFNTPSLKSLLIAVIPCLARKWTSNMPKVLHHGFLSLSICSSLSHTWLTVVPTHLYTLSSSRLILPRPRSSLQPITIVQPNTIGHMDLRWFSDGWYHSLELPRLCQRPSFEDPRQFSLHQLYLHPYQLPSDLLGLPQATGLFDGNYHKSYTLHSIRHL